MICAATVSGAPGNASCGSRLINELPSRLTASVELPIPWRGRAEWGVSHVSHAPRACHGHRHERPRHARIAPFVTAMIFGLGVDVLGPRRIMLKSRDRSNAVSVCAEAVDHGLRVLSDEAGAQLIPPPHPSAL